MDSLLRPSTMLREKKNKNKEGSSAGKKNFDQSQLEGVIFTPSFGLLAVVDAEGRRKFSDFLCGHLSDPVYVRTQT